MCLYLWIIIFGCGLEYEGALLFAETSSEKKNLDCDKPGLVCRPESMFTAVLHQTANSEMCGDWAGFSPQIAAILDHLSPLKTCGNTKKQMSHIKWNS